METSQEASQIRGLPLYASDGDKIGEIEDVFLDDQTNKPEWVRLGVGLLGLKNVLVPLEPLVREGDGLRAPYSKDIIKDAPRVDENYVSPEQESDLYRYYGLASASPSEVNERRGSPGDSMEQGAPSFPPMGEQPAAERPRSAPMREENVTSAPGMPSRGRLRRWLEG